MSNRDADGAKENARTNHGMSIAVVWWRGLKIIAILVFIIPLLHVVAWLQTQWGKING